MASTVAEEKRSRKYYHSNEKYRKKKIAKEVATNPQIRRVADSHGYLLHLNPHPHLLLKKY